RRFVLSFHDPPTTEISTLSLHDALPISRGELAGRVAVITGGASGIGRATAHLLASRGAHVVVADLNRGGGEEVAAQLESEFGARSEEHTSELQSLAYLVCRLLLEKKKKT